MVPSGPVSVLVCRVSGTWPYRSWAVSQGFEDLVAGLNRLPTVTSSWTCLYPTSTSDDLTYELKFHYSVGPDTFIRVTSRCRPGVDNYVIAANDSSSIIPLVQQLIARQP